jgi:hypothetical protein
MFYQGRMNLFFPRAVNLGKVDLAVSPRLLSQTLLKYHQAYERGILSDDDGESVEEGDSLSLVFSILEYFRHNGLYSRRKVFQTRNTGKIDWRRTISMEKPFFQKSGAPIYLDYRGSKRRYESDCDIASIHAKIVCKLITEYGVLFDQLEPPSINVSGIDLANKDYCIAKLTAELSGAYSDSDIRLLQALILYLERGFGVSESEYIIGLTAFHTVWEYMLSEVLLNTVNLVKKLPVPSYKLTFEGSEVAVDAPRKSGRMDVVLKAPRTNFYCVVDAKYYEARTLKTSPGWKDLVKQFFYAKAIKEVFPSSTVSNAFIFPGSVDHWKSAHMKNRQTGTLMNTDYVPIKCFYVDPLEVMDSFVRGTKLKGLSERILEN